MNTSAWESNTNVYLYSKRKNKAVSSCMSSQDSKSGIVDQFWTMFTNYQPCRRDQRRPIGRGRVNRAKTTPMERVCYDCGQQEHISSVEMCPRPSWRTLKRRCDKLSNAPSQGQYTSSTSNESDTAGPS